ncbi:MAG: hypothetical protein ABIP51_16265 [Bacteroidia bacterium]
MQQLVLIDKEELNVLHQKIDALTELIKSIEPGNKKNNTIKDWITLKEFCETYSVSKTRWYEVYKDFIKYRVDGKLLIYKPSMDKYLMDKAIN